MAKTSSSGGPLVLPRYARSSLAWGRPSRLGLVARQLTERDLAVLGSLAQLRLLTTTQLERLHFREGSAQTQARRCRRCLARLHDFDLVHRLERRIGGLHAGSSGFIYGLTGWGRRLIGSDGPAGGQRRRRQWEPSPPFQDHVLAVSELFVQLREAERQGQLELIDFIAEPACWRTYLGPDGAPLVLKPDAFVVTAEPDYEHLSFVEVDLGTEGQAAIRSKAERYRRNWLVGQEQRQFGVFPRIVFLAPHAERVAVLHRWLAPAYAQADLFVVGQLDQAPLLLGGQVPAGGAASAVSAQFTNQSKGGTTYESST